MCNSKRLIFLVYKEYLHINMAKNNYSWRSWANHINDDLQNREYKIHMINIGSGINNTTFLL